MIRDGVYTVNPYAVLAFADRDWLQGQMANYAHEPVTVAIMTPSNVPVWAEMAFALLRSKGDAAVMAEVVDRLKELVTGGADPGALAADVASLGFTASMTETLRRGGILTVGDLTRATQGDLLAIKGVGGWALRRIRNRLEDAGLHLRGDRPSLVGMED